MERPTDTPVTSKVSPAPTWRDVWQLPALVVAGGLIVAGAYRGLSLIPKPDLSTHLHHADALISDDHAEEAIAYLNEQVFPYVGTEKLSVAERAEYHQLMGRAIYLGQKRHSIDREDNNKNIVASYLESETLLRTLTPLDIAYMADTHISLGELSRARTRADSLPVEDRERRVGIYRRLVEEAMKPEHQQDRLAMELVSDLLTDPGLESDDRAWALGRQAELQLDSGYAEDAINRLLRELPKLEGVDAPTRGSLHLLLARAYLETGSMDAGERQAQHAVALITEHDPRYPELLVLLGHIASMHGDHDTARERFEAVTHSAAPSRWALLAELGLAQASAAANEDEAAAQSYSRLVESLHRGEQSREVTPRVVEASLIERADDRFERGRTGLALQLADLAERAIGKGEPSPSTLIRLAMCHRRSADEIIESVKKTGTSAAALADLDPATRAEVRSHLISAGGYFRRHADKVVLTDINAYSDSMWMSGDSYDRGGDQEAATRVFQVFAAERPEDPRQPEARFRLAQAYQARGDLENAAAIYRDLVQTRNDTGGAGPWADAAEVPLAQTLFADGNPENDAEAEQILRSVAGGSTGGPGTPAFKDAVIELGNHYYRKGEYDFAIERFDEAVQRYPRDGAVIASRFKLADSLRLSAGEIEKTLVQALPPAEKSRLEGVKKDRLTRAIGLFEQVRRDIEGKDARRLTATDELYMRNAYFYLGECAFHLKDYETATIHYNAAKDRFPQDPASLVAMTQIVSCHLKQGDLNRARSANERAKRFYASLPASVWEDPTLPMKRGDWERWLEATAQLWTDQVGEDGTANADGTNDE